LTGKTERFTGLRFFEGIGMFGLGWPEVIVIGVVGAAVFGTKRIPELGRSIAKTVKGFREELTAPPENVSSNISANSSEPKLPTANPPEQPVSESQE
jgi:sec-independent protein translocase protein TatA